MNNGKMKFGGEVIWQPTPEIIEDCRLKRFMNTHRLGTLSQLLFRSISEPEWFWPAVIEDLAISFRHPFRQALDLSEGAPWARWWSGGRMNIVDSCLQRHLDSGRGQRLAITWESESGERKQLTYSELNQEVERLAGGLKRLGVGIGNRIGIFLPMLPETVIALLAGARLGAVLVPLFSGYGTAAIAQRLQDQQAKVLLTADGFYHRGKLIAMKETVDQAAQLCPDLEHVVMLQNVGQEVPWQAGRDHLWKELLSEASPQPENVELDPESPLMVIYTSGTTGKPKGALHVHGGFPIKAAQDLAHGFDMGQDDLLFWFTDLGWMMGPWMIWGSLLLGGSMLLYDGAPDAPTPNRLWQLINDHQVTIFGVSPTLVRSLISKDSSPTRPLSSLRVLGGTGEPWDPESSRWFHSQVGGGRLPIINYSGGTEISGGILGGNLLTPQKPGSFAGPLPGMAADVFDAQGNSVREEVGELVIRQPWPGMTRGFSGEPERYLDAYWSTYPGVWRHGDWAYIDSDGLWYLLGRSDDTIKVAGKRVGPAEVEAILATHPQVKEAAAVGVPDPIKGEKLACFVVLRNHEDQAPELSEALCQLVEEALGRPLRPSLLYCIPDLPKTRNAKILRRLVRGAYLGLDLGDVSALENPDSLTAIRAIRDTLK